MKIRYFWRYMAPTKEGEEGGGAGEEEETEQTGEQEQQPGNGQDQPQNQPPPNQDDLRQTVQQMQSFIAQQNEQLQQMHGYIQGIGNERRQSQQTDPEDDFSDLDPTVQKYVQKQLRAMQATVGAPIGSIQDQIDRIQFQTMLQSEGADPEVVQLTERLYQDWTKRGWKAPNGQPLSRIDALNQATGMIARHQKLKGKHEKVVADTRRKAGNEDAVVEQGSRGGAGGRQEADPDKMTPQQRAEDYWPSVLDANGPW